MTLSQSRPTGSSATADAFNARISVADHGQSLFYVVAHNGTPDAAVRAVGGQVMTRLAAPGRALALAPLSAHSQLRDHPALKLAGPVTIDPDRFQRFARLIGAIRKPSHPSRTSDQH